MHTVTVWGSFYEYSKKLYDNKWKTGGGLNNVTIIKKVMRTIAFQHSIM